MAKKTGNKKRRATFKDWYTRNRKSYNAKRVLMYQEDAELRQTARDRAARNREEKKNRTTFELVRLQGGGTGYRFDHVAHLLNTTEQTIRNWEMKGYAKPPTISTRPRIYSEQQYMLLAELKAGIQMATLKSRKIDANSERFVSALNNIQENWNDG